MTEIQRSHTNQRMSQIVEHGDTVYLAGQVAADPEADIQEQTRSTLARVDEALTEAGTDREHLEFAPPGTAREWGAARPQVERRPRWSPDRLNAQAARRRVARPPCPW